MMWILTGIWVALKSIWCKIKGREYDSNENYYGRSYEKEDLDG